MEKFFKNKSVRSIERSLVKSIVFRVITIIADLIVIYFLTHRFDLTLGVTIFTNISSTFLYFIHERVWAKIKWGKTAVTETMPA